MLKQRVSYVKGHTDLIHCTEELTIEIMLRNEVLMPARRNNPIILHTILSCLLSGFQWPFEVTERIASLSIVTLS
jgi:hypothetical protein